MLFESTTYFYLCSAFQLSKNICCPTVAQPSESLYLLGTYTFCIGK